MDDRLDYPESVRVQVTLAGEHLAAVDGWRAANGITSRADAVSELVRLGLLSEIAQVYRLISGRGGREEKSGSQNGDADIYPELR